MDAAVKRAVARFGGLDAAIAAAGVIAGGSPAWETPEAVWDAMLQVNLAGVWRLAQAALPALLARPEPRTGRFIAISSVAGLRGFPSLAAYSAAKHGVIGLIRSLAAELGESGVTANVVCPGSMDTAMLAASAQIYGLTDVQEFAKYHHNRRLLEPVEVARVVGWLCSPESGGMTGSVLPVDAGMTAS
jgi:SDR family mycofactocin-dependent oxidoreductase